MIKECYATQASIDVKRNIQQKIKDTINYKAPNGLN